MREDPEKQEAQPSAARPRRITAYLLLVAAYVVSGKLGLMLALPPGYASAIFPPAGIAVAAALIGGRRTLPWIFLGSLLLNLGTGYSASHQIDLNGLAAAAIIAVASMLQAAAGGAWLRRLIGYPTSLDNGADLVRFFLSAPVICLTSASLSVGGLWAIGVIGTEGVAMSWGTWWVGDTIGVLVMLPVVLVVAGEPRALWRRRALSVALPIALGFALFVLFFIKVSKWEHDDSLMEFRLLSQQVVGQVQTRLEEQESLLEQLAGLFQASAGVSRGDFHRFVARSLVRFPMVQAVEWVPRVEPAGRAGFEAAQRKAIRGFDIRERDAAGPLRRAAGQGPYYPVTYVEPLAGNESVIGFDLGSTPQRRAALDKAVETGAVVATAPVRLVQQGGQWGVLLNLAVKDAADGPGFVLSVLRMGEFMGQLSSFARGGLYVRFADLDERQTLYDSFPAGTRAAFYEQRIKFGMRHYRLQTAPTPAYLAEHKGWQSWGALVTGLFGTSLLGGLLLLGTGHTARAEALVAERTRRLAESEAHFRNILEYAPIGMAVVSLGGRFLQVNRALCEIVGYPKEELEGLTFQQITHPDDLALDLANAQRLLDGEIGSYQMEKRYLRKDGQPVWAQLTGSLLKDASGAPLYFIAQIEDVTERKRSEEQIRQLAYFDTLTNLPNRRLLLDRLHQAVAQAKHFHRSMAVMFLDLDRFKQINDTLGHDVGDELLKVVATRLTGCIRSGDTVCRQGGDEFVMVLAEVAHPEDAALVAEKAIKALNEPVVVGTHRLHVTTSIGIAVYPVNGTDDVLALMKKADMAMYAAKEAGRNRFHFYPAESA